jgi:hypothetical protein
MANPAYSTDLGLGQFPETKDPKSFPDILRIYNALHKLQGQLDKYTGNVPVAQANFSQPSPVRVLATATVPIAAGSLLNFQIVGTTLQAQLADIGLVLMCQGIAIRAALLGAQVECMLFGTSPSLFIGLVPGAYYYLGAAGALSAAPTAQRVGMAISPTSMWLNV